MILAREPKKGALPPITEEADMKVERSESIESGKVKRVIAYRVAVVTIAFALLELAEMGRISTPYILEKLREISRGKT